MYRPNCYKCKYRRDLSGDAHSKCVARLIFKKEISVKGNLIGIRRGWFNYPFNFDPTWLEECDGFERIEKAK